MDIGDRTLGIRDNTIDEQNTRYPLSCFTCSIPNVHYPMSSPASAGTHAILMTRGCRGMTVCRFREAHEVLLVSSKHNSNPIERDMKIQELPRCIIHSTILELPIHLITQTTDTNTMAAVTAPTAPDPSSLAWQTRWDQDLAELKTDVTFTEAAIRDIKNQPALDRSWNVLMALKRSLDYTQHHRLPDLFVVAEY